MALSFRLLYWFPASFLVGLNLLFKLIIYLLQHFGNAIVWVNRQIIRAGDYCTDKAQNDQSLDEFFENIHKKKKARMDKIVRAKNKIYHKKHVKFPRNERI